MPLQGQSPPALKSAKLADNATAPVIDGRVNEAVWQTVQPYATFTQQDPTEGAPATEKTEIRLIVGKGQVYIGIVCYDSDPSKIIVSQAQRDDSLSDTDSVITRVEYSVDAQRWQLAFPRDGILDGRQESFEIRLDADAAGRTLVVRATDALGNIGTGQAVVR